MDNFKFNIGDIVNTDNSSYQYCDPRVTWKSAVNCNCKSHVLFNQRIVDRISSDSHNWYKFDGIGNWYEESCISLVSSKYIDRFVHCKNQEEWDFAAKKLYRTDPTVFNKYGNCISLKNPNSSSKKSYLEKDKTNEILSFEDWCKEFGHTFVDSIPKLGKYYYVSDGGFWMIGKVTSETNYQNDSTRGRATIITREEEFKINDTWCFKSNKGRSFRDATKEEIEWLDYSIKKNEFVSKEDFLKSKVKPKFEIGKWYKVTNSTNNNWYSKFKELKDDRFYFSDIIDIGKKEYGNDIKRNLGLYFSLSCKFEFLTDISVIQEFLPEGHVDKVKKGIIPVIGNFYTSNCGNICRWGIFDSDAYIGDDQTSFRLGKGNFIVSNLRLATEEEKQWLDACIKANKFIPKKEALKPEENWFPKVGDYLYVIDGRGNNAKEGSIAKVTKPPFNDAFFKDRKGVNVEWIKILPEGKNQQNGNYYFDIFRKVLPHEIPVETSNKEPMKKIYKFKVGDIVKFKSSDSKNAIYFKGNLKNLIIQDTWDDSNCYDYKIKNDNCTWGVKEDELEFETTKSENNITNRFKVGDIIIGNSLNDYYYTNKTNRCTVIGVESNNKIRVKLLDLVYNINNDIIFTVFSDHFDLYKEKSLTKQELLEEAKVKYPIGTVFKSLGIQIDTLFTVKNDLYYDDKGITHVYIGYIYYEGKWAEIVNLPNVECKKNDILQTDYFQIVDFKQGGKQLPKKDNLEFQEPIIVKTNKNKKFKLVTINQ